MRPVEPLSNATLECAPFSLLARDLSVGLRNAGPIFKVSAPVLLSPPGDCEGLFPGSHFDLAVWTAANLAKAAKAGVLRRRFSGFSNFSSITRLTRIFPKRTRIELSEGAHAADLTILHTS